VNHIPNANTVRNPDMCPRTFRLLIDKNLSVALAVSVAADPRASRAVLGDLMPGPLAARRIGARRRA
jgi:hypothetical protein